MNRRTSHHRYARRIRGPASTPVIAAVRIACEGRWSGERARRTGAVCTPRWRSPSASCLHGCPPSCPAAHRCRMVPPSTPRGLPGACADGPRAAALRTGVAWLHTEGSGPQGQGRGVAVVAGVASCHTERLGGPQHTFAHKCISSQARRPAHLRRHLPRRSCSRRRGSSGRRRGRTSEALRRVTSPGPTPGALPGAPASDPSWATRVHVRRRGLHRVAMEGQPRPRVLAGRGYGRARLAWRATGRSGRIHNVPSTFAVAANPRGASQVLPCRFKGVVSRRRTFGDRAHRARRLPPPLHGRR